MTGRTIEVSGLRTPTTSVFVNPDGTTTLQGSTYQRNLPDAAGVLAPVDTTLASRPDGTLAAKRHALSPRFAAVEKSDAVAVATRAGDITFGLTAPAVSRASQTAADQVKYAQVQAGVDLEYQVLPDAVKETLVLANAGAASSYSFTYNAPGMTASQLADGTIAFRDIKGVVAVIPPGAAWDSAATPSTVPVKLVLVGSGPSVKVQVSIDPTWLGSPLRVWPVRIDPGVALSANASTAYKSDGYTCTTCGIRGGNSQSAGDTYWRSTVHFPYESLFGKNILASSISTTVTSGSVNCYNHIWYTVGSEAYGGYVTPQTGAANLCSTGLASGSTLTNTLQTYADASTANKRFFVRGQESAGVYTYKEMSATLSVTYNSKPSEPRGRSIKPCFSCSANPVPTASLTPALTAASTDSDGNSLRYQFQVFSGSSPAANATPIADSGLLSPAQAQNTIKSWTVPAGVLVNGSTYSYRARANDGTDYGNWSNVTGGWAVFKVDTTKPLVPTVVSASYPEGAWADVTTGTFTLGNGGSADIVGYYTRLDSAAQAYQTSTSLTLSNVTQGPHHLYVQSIDGAGNLSPVRDYAFNAGIGAIISPAQGDRTQKKVKLLAQSKPSYTTARFQYRRGASDPWVDIPLAALRRSSDGSTLTSLDIPITNGATLALDWDVTLSPNVGTADGPVQVQATFSPGVTSNITPANELTLDQTGAGFASDSIGPGSVNLITGNFTVGASDVSIDAYASDLTLSRTFSSRAPSASATGMFGPGWVSSVGVQGVSSDYTSLTVNGTLVSIGTIDGTSIGFTRNPDNVSYKPEIGFEDLTLTSNYPATTYTLKDLDGNTTVFAKPDSTFVTFVPTAITLGGTSQTTSITYDATTKQPTRLLAPTPSTDITCTAPPGSSDQLSAGCRAIEFNYAPNSTSAPAPGTFGDYPGRISSVKFYGGTNGAPTNPLVAPGIPVAQYAYDSTGRLAQAWDPRISPSLKTLYNYNPNLQISDITPPGQTKWTITYADSAGRLQDVRRVNPDTTLGTAVTTVLYGIPISGAGAPYDLGSAARATWGQTSVPTDVTAIVPPLADNYVATSADLNKAVVHYLDVSGRETNTAAPGGRISSVDYDSYGNSIRTLSPSNRQRALDSSTDTLVQAATSRRLDEQNIYSTDGQLLLETFAPERDTVVGGAVVRARTHTVNTYDEGAPSTGGPYRLLTTSKTGARVDGATTDSEVRTSATGYDWTLRQPTSTTVDPSGTPADATKLNLVSRTAYDSTTGLVVSSTLPGSTGLTTAQTTMMTYYTKASNATYPSCGGKPEWAGLLCRTGPGGQPAPATGRPAIPATYTQYTIWNTPSDVIVKNDTTGSTLRTSHTDYDAAGRPTVNSVIANTTPASVAVPTTTTTYNPTNGQVASVSYSDAAGLHTISNTYDAFARKISYSDGDGGTASITKFDLRGRLIASTDGKGTQTRAYDPVTGDQISLVDSQAGTWTATYTTAGDLSQVTYPGGLTKKVTTDETGTATDLVYTLPSPCSSNCVLADRADENTFGQQVTHNSSLSSQTYTYDAASRLTGVQDTVGDTCTSRSYFFASDSAGKDSNRTGYASVIGTPGAACPALPSSPSTTYSYDTADRAIDSGYAYDELGRTTTLPGAATLTGASQAPSYYGNDLAATLGTSTFVLDPTSSRYRAITTPAGTSIRHYDDDGDSPTWSTNPANSAEYERIILGLDGDLAAIRNYDASIAIQLTSLHGDVIATTTVQPGSDGLTSTSESTEFGAPRNSAEIASKRYGWLGAKTREADNPAGIIRMGVRLYNPATGRFLSVDPVQGGSANDYAYPTDPVNAFDLDGRRWGLKRPKWQGWKSVANIAGVAAFGACVVFSAGVCIAAGAAAAVASGRASAGGFRQKAFVRSFAENLAVNTTGGILGARLAMTGMGKWGLQLSKHGRPGLLSKLSGWERAPIRLPWGGYAMQAIRGTSYCGVTRSCPW